MIYFKNLNDTGAIPYVNYNNKPVYFNNNYEIAEVKFFKYTPKIKVLYKMSDIL